LWEGLCEKLDLVNAAHAIETILVLLNSSILLTILMSLIFSAKNDLMFLESIAAVYNTAPLEAIKQYGADVRNSILYLISGLILIVISTGYQSYIIRSCSSKRSKLLLPVSFSSIILWSILLILIIELILFPRRATILLNAPLPSDILVQVSKALTNLDIFRWWLCMIVFSILTTTVVIMLIWAVILFKFEKEHLIEIIFSLSLYILSYLFLSALPSNIVYPGGLIITSGVYGSEIPPRVWFIVMFRPDQLLSVVKVIAHPSFIFFLLLS